MTDPATVLTSRLDDLDAVVSTLARALQHPRLPHDPALLNSAHDRVSDAIERLRAHRAGIAIAQLRPRILRDMPAAKGFTLHAAGPGASSWSLAEITTTTGAVPAESLSPALASEISELVTTLVRDGVIPPAGRGRAPVHHRVWL